MCAWDNGRVIITRINHESHMRSHGVEHKAPRLEDRIYETRTSYRLGIADQIYVNKKFWGDPIAYVSFIRHGLYRKRRAQQLFYCCVCASCRGNVITVPFPSKDEGNAQRQRQQGDLYGLVIRDPDYRSRGPGSIPGATRISEKSCSSEVLCASVLVKYFVRVF
jgi:hypothetical protein